MTLQKLAVVLLAVYAELLVGCSSKESIVTGGWIGTMKQDGLDIRVNAEFFSDKSVTFKYEGTPVASGNWSVLNDGRIKAVGDISFTTLTGGSTTILGEISNDSLILDFGTYGKVSFTKLSSRAALAQAEADANAPIDAAHALTEAGYALTKARLAQVQGAITMFNMSTGDNPSSLQLLLKADGTPNWPKPYLNSEEILVDAWGTPFSYKREGSSFWVISACPDRIAGTPDDIK